MTRTRSSLGWTVEGTEGSRKEVGSVQGEGDDGRGAVDTAAPPPSSVCIRLFLRTRLRQRRSARRWVGSWNIHLAGLEMERPQIAHRRGHKGEGGRRGRARKYPLFFRSSLFFLRLCPSLFPPSDLLEASLPRWCWVRSGSFPRGRRHPHTPATAPRKAGRKPRAKYVKV